MLLDLRPYRVDSFYRTYEGLKQQVVLHRIQTPHRFYRTYEGLKLDEFEREQAACRSVFIVPMRD